MTPGGHLACAANGGSPDLCASERCMKTCTQCGLDVADDDLLCGHCGHDVKVIALPLFPEEEPALPEEPPVLPDNAVRRLASHMVQRATIGVNTFPSGHVAVSLAAALAVMDSMPLAGGVFLILAVSVSLACCVGRFHYVVDVLAGAVLAAVVWGAVNLAGI